MAKNDDTIDLLSIAESLDTINGEDIGGDYDYGMNFNYLSIGMSGSKMVDSLNSNFRAIDSQFQSQEEELSIRIISNNIKNIKEEDGIIYYTTDGEIWNSLQASWGKIVGKITDQKDLKAILDTVAYKSDLTPITSDIASLFAADVILRGDITSINNAIQTLNNTIEGTNGIIVRLGNLENSMVSKVSSDDILQIRGTHGVLEYTFDGTNWYSTADSGSVDWGSILGDIQNQADLINYLNRMSVEITARVESSIGEELSSIEADIEDIKNKIGSASSVNLVSESTYISMLNEQALSDFALYLVDDSELIPATDVSIQSNIEMLIGDTYTLSYSPIPSYGSISKAEFTSSSSEISVIGNTVQALELVTGASINAKFTTSSGTIINKTILVNVVQLSPVSSISIISPDSTIYIGNLYDTQYNLTPINCDFDTISFESNKSDIAAVDDNGNIEPKSTGTFTLTVKVVNKDGSIVTATKNIEVKNQ